MAKEADRAGPPFDYTVIQVKDKFDDSRDDTDTSQTSQQTGDVPRSMLDMQPHWPLAMSCTGIHEDMREGLH